MIGESTSEITRSAPRTYSFGTVRGGARREQTIPSEGSAVPGFLSRIRVRPRRSVFMGRRPASARDNEPADVTPAAEFMVWDRGQMKRAKVCCTCGQQMTWRKSWEKSWDTVKYCSDRCRTDGRRNNRISQRLHIAAARPTAGRSEETVLLACSVIAVVASEAMSESTCSHE